METHYAIYFSDGYAQAIYTLANRSMAAHLVDRACSCRYWHFYFRSFSRWSI